MPLNKSALWKYCINPQQLSQMHSISNKKSQSVYYHVRASTGCSGPCNRHYLRSAAFRWATKLPGTTRSPSHVQFLLPSMLFGRPFVQNNFIRSLSRGVSKAAECSNRSIINISNNLCRFGNVRIPPTQVGWLPTVIPPMIEALCDCLPEKPGLYVDEMALFLWDEFCVSRSQIQA